MEFRILGPLEALDEGRVVRLGGSKQRALLALFLLHANETLTTDRLIDELWGDRPPATASKTVQMQVSRLRKALAAQAAGGVVVTRERGYELELDPERLDSHRFERLLDEGRSELAAGHPERAAAALDAALAMWRGAPLADLAYEAFAQREIARLEDLHARALEQLIEAKLALGSHAEVIPQLETLIAEHPYRERLRAQLMLALYRCDRQADALQAYQDARRTLVEELGIEPGARLRELEQAILAQDPALAAPVGRDVGDAARRGPAPAELPTGVVTFLLTDIEDSSGLWEADREAMAAALELHDELIARTVDAHSGRLLKTKGEGDATVTAFRRASDAVAAAVDIQAAVGAAWWPGGLELRVRIALHTGEAHERAGDYFGPALNRAARLRALTRGGATVVSQATAEIVHDRLPPEVELVDLGRHELRGLSRPENVFELRVMHGAVLTHESALGVPYTARPADMNGIAGSAAPPRPLALRGPVVLTMAALLVVGAALLALLQRNGEPEGFAGPDLDAATNSLVALDATARRPERAVPLPGRPTGLAAAENDLLIPTVDSAALTAVSIRRGSISRTVPLRGEPDGVAVGEGGAWVSLGARGLLVRIEPGYEDVSLRARYPRARRPPNWAGRLRVPRSAVAVGAGSVWVTNGSRSLSRVDPASGRVTGVRLPLEGNDVAVGAGAVWVMSARRAAVMRVDPQRAAVSERITLAGRPGGNAPFPIGIAAAADAVWVLNGNTATTTQIDPVSRAIVRNLELGVERVPNDIAAAGRTAWVANSDGTLSRVDAGATTARSIWVGESLEEVATNGRRVWATTTALDQKLPGGAG